MRIWLTLIIMAIPSAAMPAAAPDGAAIFNRTCTVCHRPDSGTRAPLPAVLRQMTQESILRALETGKMQAQGSMLTGAERQAVAKYLGIPNPVAAVPGKCFLCDADSLGGKGSLLERVGCGPG